MYRLLAICVFLATVTDGAHGQLFPRWLSRGQLPAPRQHAAGAAVGRNDELPTSAVDTTWSKAADGTGNSVMYFVETKQELTKQELFVFGDSVPAQIMTPGTAKVTRAPATSTSAPATSTSAPATITSAPVTSTSVAATSTKTPTTSTIAPATSTSAPATSTRMPNPGTSAPNRSSNAQLSSSTIPPASTSVASTTVSTPNTTLSTPPPTRTIPQGYTYYAATGSYYNFHHERYVSWYVANTTCASEGAHLVVLNDSEEADVVLGVVKGASNDYYGSWTGLRDNRPGGVMEWRSIHGEPINDVYHYWEDGRPYNNAGSTCVLFSAYNKRLYDVPCDWSRYFTCEISR